MTDERATTFRRIVVGVDASAASLDAVAAAADLARRVGAELAGLFVEDEDLLRLAALPFARVVRVPSGAREAIDREAAERELRAVAARAREAIERAASGRRVSASFRVRRGRVVAEVLAAAGEEDLLVLGTAGYRRSREAALGQTARAAAARAASSVLLLRRGGTVAGRVVAVDDASARAARAILLARALSGPAGPTIVDAGSGAVGVLSAALAGLAPALLIVPAGAACPTGSSLDALLASGTAVLVVR